ncbi:FecR family protein [Agrobacterium fabrum]|uniref:FecR family protein n=1 Tax=Agrobacterium fabrum TaxID=1176649 RepID=UPI000F0CC6FE|nr:FecR family protein [Agrobacterium fabrum]AYM64516.1 iron dicitrate transporter FecR [Agrobacterium fabrum]WLP56474.1 FecR family protein [Agrobacterium fabrum]
MQRRRLTRDQRKRNREAADWVFRNRDPDQPETELAEFRRWMELDPENCRAYTAAKRILGEARTAIRSDAGLREAPVSSSSRGRNAIISSIIAIAAAGTLFVALDGPMRMSADIMSGTDEMPEVTLEDGSRVQLNASSAIALDFTSERRTVRLLRGQAFFQVSPDAKRPFAVSADDTLVTALGTAFDVRQSVTDTRVAVTEHSVRVDFKAQGALPVKVGEGEEVLHLNETGKSTIRKTDANTALAWRRGQLTVDNMPLSYVIEEIQRHFHGRIVIGNEATARRVVSGTLFVTDTESALNFLRSALNIQTYKIGPIIVVTS